MEIVGLIASVIIGISLGLIGGGGSILTVPVLVYLFGIDPIIATTYSLFIVGSTSLVGVYPKYKEGMISLKTAFVFGIPSIISVLSTRKFIIPAIPDTVFTLGTFEVTKPIFMMLFFALLMLVASIRLVLEKKCLDCKDTDEPIINYPFLILQGLIVGLFTGLVGAGGGFLIIPALVMFSKLPMKKAIGTTLLIIAANSLIGFIGDTLHIHSIINWKLLLTITALAIMGIFVGNYLSKFIDGHKLKKAFGIFVFFMGIYVIVNELYFVS